MHKNCINKEKLIFIIKNSQKGYENTEIDLLLDILIQKIRKGDFDYE